MADFANCMSSALLLLTQEGSVLSLSAYFMEHVRVSDHLHEVIVWLGWGHVMPIVHNEFKGNLLVLFNVDKRELRLSLRNKKPIRLYTSTYSTGVTETNLDNAL